MGQASFADGVALPSPRCRPSEDAVEANWLIASLGRVPSFARPLPLPFGPSFTAGVLQTLPRVGGVAATTGIPERLATAEGCPAGSPAFLSPDAPAGSLLVAMGAALWFFPPAGKLVVAGMLADGVDGKAERPGAALAACAPTNCSISRSPNDAAGAAVAAGISEVAADGLSAVTGTGAINPSASGDSRIQEACQVPSAGCRREIVAEWRNRLDSRILLA